MGGRRSDGDEAVSAVTIRQDRHPAARSRRSRVVPSIAVPSAGRASGVYPGGVTLPVTVETNPAVAPGYLRHHVRRPAPGGADDLLADGAWCGHGEQRFRIFELHGDGDAELRLSLPTEDEMEDHEPLALASAGEGEPFTVYDARLWLRRAAARPATPTAVLTCGCGGTRFRVAVGFEVPADAESSDDVTWFALAARCIACGEGDIVFEDEIGS